MLNLTGAFAMWTDVAEKLGGKRSTPGFEYECVGKYNYSKAELSVSCGAARLVCSLCRVCHVEVTDASLGAAVQVMVEVISMCKSLASVMAQAEPALGPILRCHAMLLHQHPGEGMAGQRH